MLMALVTHWPCFVLLADKFPIDYDSNFMDWEKID